METKELTCINCPLGCMVSVTLDQGEIIQITGNSCKRGEDYARKEITNPMRIVTSTILVLGGVSPLVSCKTKEDIPKQKISQCMEEIKVALVKAPVHIGDILIHNVAGTGVDVVATKDIDANKDIAVNKDVEL